MLYDNLIKNMYINRNIPHGRDNTKGNSTTNISEVIVVIAISYAVILNWKKETG